MPASAPSAAVRLYGTEQIDPPLRTLRAGPLSVEFDNGALRYIRIDGIEVLRGISFLVRDENWGTFTPKIEDLDLHEDDPLDETLLRSWFEQATALPGEVL